MHRFLFLLCWLPTMLTAQADLHSLDKILEANFAPDAPGLSLLVLQHDRVRYARQRGMANLSHGVPLGPETRFSVGSLTKQFTAALILHLQDRKMLDVRDTIGRYLPDFPTTRFPITLHQLLRHTSGIPDYPRDPEIRARMRHELSPQDILRWASEQTPDFSPGIDYAYSNTGYFLLGAVIESVTGKTYEDYLRETIFAPAGMQHSRCQDFFRVQPKRATPYDRDDAGEVIHITPHAYSYAAGGIFSTARDLARWWTYLRSDRFLTARTRSVMFTDEGYGWEKATLCGKTSWEHTGYEPGFKASCVYVPGAELFVVALQNTEADSPTPFVLRAAALVLDAPFPAWENAVTPPVKLTTAVTGRFLFPENQEREIRLRDDQLLWHTPGGTDQSLYYLNDSTLFFREGYRQLVFSEDYTTVAYRNREYRTEAVRTGAETDAPQATISLTPTELDTYAGAYRTEAFTIHVFRRAGGLFAQPEGSEALPLTPVAEGKFLIPAIGAELTFSGPDNAALSILLDGQTFRGERQ